MKILIHCPASGGGLAEHVHYQARAFARRGAEVLVLCPHDYLQGRTVDYPVSRLYGSLVREAKARNLLGRVGDLLRRTAIFLASQWRLAWEVAARRPDFVLFDSYGEYLAPLWVWPHVALNRLLGMVYVANLHDPVRDFIVGPRWWHNFSVRLAYWPINIAIVHQHLPDTSVVPSHVTVIQAPVGVYELQESAVDPMEVRREWGLPQDAIVFLSFGFVRDNKNLDLLIRALPEVPEAFLVVMGSSQSSINRPLKFYRDLAASIGVARRVIFREEFVPDEALQGYFMAADFVAITYNSRFHSQSGVLNIAARAKRPVLASSGESPLKASVQQFRLGEFVKPDSLADLTMAMRDLCHRVRHGQECDTPEWDGYMRYASWDSNVSAICKAVKSVSDEK